MEYFQYSLFSNEPITFYVSVLDITILISSSVTENYHRKENIQDFSWGVCLQNIVLFSVSLMAELNFVIRECSFKKNLNKILHRIKQFEKLGNIDLSERVLVLFIQELFQLIQSWFDFCNLFDQQENQRHYLIESTVGLICTFHILFYHVTYKIRS